MLNIMVFKDLKRKIKIATFLSHFIFQPGMNDYIYFYYDGAKHYYTDYGYLFADKVSFVYSTLQYKMNIGNAYVRSVFKLKAILPLSSFSRRPDIFVHGSKTLCIFFSRFFRDSLNVRHSEFIQEVSKKLKNLVLNRFLIKISFFL